jgi:hypothetical protein
MSASHRALLTGGTVVAALWLAGTGLAQQKVAPSFSVRPVLVKSAGGAFVSYELDRRAVRARVSIAGHIARISHVGGAKDFVYDAFVKDASLHSGKIYAVNITVVSVTGGTATRSEKLLLHRTFPHG